MSIDVGRAIARLERAEHLRAAEQNGAWVIRRSRIKRVRGKSECEERVHDALSCLHGVSYTLACGKCRRSVSEAKINLEALKRKLSIT